MGGHLNHAKGAGPGRVGRNISEGVLIANIASDTVANRGHLIELAREEGLTSGGFRETAQYPRISIWIGWFENADGVNQRPGFRDSSQNVFQVVAARVVGTVADDQEHFPISRAGFELRLRLDDR